MSAARGVAVALFGAIAVLVLMAIVPASSHRLGPATVSIRAALGSARTVVAIPPLGTVAAPTHDGPATVEVTLTRIDPAGLGRVVGSPTGREFLERAIEEDLRAAAAAAARRLVIAGAIIGAVAALVLPRRRWSNALEGAVGGAAATALLLFTIGTNYDVDAFREPRFTGALSRAPEVIEVLTETVPSLEELRSRYQTAARRLTELMALVAEPAPGPAADSVAILHISDVHSNPLGVELAGELARRFGVDAVVDTGDVTSFGAPVEARIGDLIRRIPVPYLYVPGNHDSHLNRRALGRRRNVVLLAEDTAEVAGITIMGWADPTFTASNEVTTEEGNQARLAEAGRVAEEVERLEPDVLAVHDRRLAAESFGAVPLVLAGHTHEQDLEEIDESVVLTVGSTGATGLGTFLVESDAPYEAQVVYFRGTSAVAVDYIKFEGLGSDFEVQRTTLPQL